MPSENLSLKASNLVNPAETLTKETFTDLKKFMGNIAYVKLDVRTLCARIFKIA